MDFITCNIGNLVTHTKERRGRREKALPPINSMNRGKLTFRTAYALYQTNDQTRLPTRCCFIQGKRMTEIEPVYWGPGKRKIRCPKCRAKQLTGILSELLMKTLCVIF